METNDIDEAIPTALVVKKKGIPLVWILPIIAACLGGWLIYKSITEADIPITLHFSSGEGLSAGKTEVRYQGIVIGKVDTITLEKDLKGVVAKVSIDRRARQALKSETTFWLVRPEVSFGGIRGLDTLLSGNYIAIKLGEGTEQYDFTALSKAPPVDDNSAGLSLLLTADNLGSIHVGSPIHYRKITVGKIVSHQLDYDKKKIDLKAHIDTEHAYLIRKNTRFWNSSGISLSGSLPHIKLKTDSLASLIAGGISFDTPAHEEPGEHSQHNERFKLYEDFEAAQSGITVTIELDSAEAITAGHTPVKYKGLTVATVRNIKVNADLTGVIVEALFDPRVNFALNSSTRFWLVKPTVSLSEISGLGTLFSGAYLEMDFGEGEPQKQFTALKTPPALDDTVPGLHLALKTETLGGLSRGSEIYFRQIAIGSVQNYTLDKSHKHILLDIFIKPEYQHLITPHTHFYNASGITITGGLEGLELKTQSLAAIMKGGIAIYNPETSPGLTATTHVANGHQYILYPDQESAAERGPTIAIEFREAEGLKVGTELKYQGISIGEVETVKLNPKNNQVVVTASLLPSARHLAKDTSQFWITRAQLGLSSSANLGTLISGVYISVKPGSGKTRYQFQGLAKAPTTTIQQTGLQLILQAEQLGSLKQDAPVYYRDVPVGKVTGYSLGSTAQYVDISVNIEDRFASLVTSESKFWNISGLAIDFSLFRGAKIRTDSLESILAGGIAFATPEGGENAGEGSRFKLHSEAEDAWLQWNPAISLPMQ